MPTVVAGFDPGNSQSTLALRLGSKVKTFTIPSYVGGGNVDHFLNIKRGMGQAGGLDDDEMAILMDGSQSFVGDLALQQSKTASTQRGSISRYSNGHTLRLLLAQLGKLFKEPVTLRLVTGLPIKFMSDSAKKHIQQTLIGHHRYQWVGKAPSHAGDRWYDRDVTIDAVAVLMESGAVLYDVATQPVPQLVADPGGGTLDLYYAVGRKPQYELCDSFDDCGIDTIGDQLRATALAMPNGRYLADTEIKATLHAFVHKKALPTLYSAGVPLVLNGEIAKIVKSVGDTQVAHVRRKWEDTNGQVAPAAAYARLIGGGAHFLFDRYKEIIPQIVRVAQPETANALAYLAVAEAARDDAWARNRG